MSTCICLHNNNGRITSLQEYRCGRGSDQDVVVEEGVRQGAADAHIEANQLEAGLVRIVVN